MVLEVISVMRRTRGAVVVVKEERNAEVGQRCQRQPANPSLTFHLSTVARCCRMYRADSKI